MTLLKNFANMILLYLSKYSRVFLNFVQPHPIEASIQVTERCNSRCITCNFWKRNSKNEISFQDMESIFYQLKEVGIKAIGFTGGEPLLRDDIGELVKKAKEITRAKIYIITNGLLLSEKARTIVESGIDYVSVSLDGIGETDEKIRGITDHYEKALRGVEVLRNLKKNLPINIGTTLVKANLPEVPQLIETCKKLNVNWSYNLLDKNLYFFKDIDVSQLLINDEDLVDETFDYLHKIIKKRPKTIDVPPLCLDFARDYLKNKKPDFHCSTGYLRIFITPNLDVCSGCWVLPPLGNLRKASIKDIITSERYKERVKQMFALNCPRCTCGYALSISIEHLPSTFIQTMKNIGQYKKYFLMQD